MRALGTAAAVCWLLTAQMAVAGPVELTADQMRDYGQKALLQGYADQALGVAGALLQRDAADAVAWVLQAQALRLKGDLVGSEAAARKAWAVATTPADRYAAATALAQALSLQDHRTRAQYWLRQAVQNAPNGATRTQAVQDFNYVRDQNPVSLQFSGSVRPSDNVNGGGKVLAVLVSTPFGPFYLPLPSTLLALSGTSWALGVSGQYRLSDDGTTDTALTFGANIQGVVLSQEAEAKAPDLNNQDFLYRQVQVGWQRRDTLGFGRLTSAVNVGHSWYGTADLADSLTTELTLDHKLAPDLDMQLDASITRQVRLDSFDNSSTTYAGSATLAKTLAKGDQIAASLDLTRVSSVSPGTDRQESGLTLQWKAGQPVLGLGLSANLSARYALYANQREDRRYAAGLSATVNRMTYLGFAPVLSLDVAHNGSNVPWFTSDTVALGLSLKSRF